MEHNHNPNEDLNDLNEVINRRLKGDTAPMSATTDPEVPSAKTAVGELRLIETDQLVIPSDRFRSRIEVEDLVNSIRTYGQFVPILVRPNMRLINGLRRATACKELGVPVLAHVVDVADEQAAEIEEDRCREDLTPYAMYRVTEAPRPRLEDEAWARKVLGKRVYDKAMKKGRVDDMLADHVGVSRGTLRKIREMIVAWENEPTKFQEVKEALEADGRVDRHYKAFKALKTSAYEGPKLSAIGFTSDWQSAMLENPTAVMSAVQRLDLKQMVTENAYLILPSTIEALPAALALLAKTGAKLEAALRGHDQMEDILLFAKFGKPTDSPEALADIQSTFTTNSPMVEAFAKLNNRATSVLINLADSTKKDQ